MCPRRYRHDFREASIHGPGNQAKLLLCGTSELAGVGEVTVDPKGKICAAETMLQRQVQARIFAGRGSVQRQQDGSDQKKAEYDPGLDGQPGTPCATLAVTPRCLGTNPGCAFPIHGFLILGHARVCLQLPRCRSDGAQSNRAIKYRRVSRCGDRHTNRDYNRSGETANGHRVRSPVPRVHTRSFRSFDGWRKECLPQSARTAGDREESDSGGSSSRPHKPPAAKPASLITHEASRVSWRPSRSHYSGSATNRYPTPRTVCKCVGCDGSSSMYRRSRTTKLSMARVSVSSCNPHTSSRIALRETTRPSLFTRYRSSSASITVRWIVFPSVRNSSSSKSIVLPPKLNMSPPVPCSPSGARRVLSRSLSSSWPSPLPARARSRPFIHTLRRSKLSNRAIRIANSNGFGR